MPEKPLVPYKSLKQKQKARIADWMYRETLRFFLEHQRMPEAEEFELLYQTVYAKVRSSNYRVAYEEIQHLYAKRLDSYALRIQRDAEAGITLESLTKQPKQKKTGKAPRPRKKKKREPAATESWRMIVSFLSPDTPPAVRPMVLLGKKWGWSLGRTFLYKRRNSVK